MLSITALSFLRRSFRSLGALKALAGRLAITCCKLRIFMVNCVCGLTTSISAVAGRLLREPSLTISCTSYVPGRSGRRRAIFAVGFEITALLRFGVETSDQL